MLGCWLQLLVHNIITVSKLFHKLTQDEKKARDLAIDISDMPKKMQLLKLTADNPQ